MKTILIKIFCSVSILILLVGCFGWGGNEGDFPPPTSSFTPVVMQRTDFENSVGTLSSRNIIKSGKIYIYEDLLFINEVNDGFHVYNYENPTNPLPINYIKIPGATDLAIRDGLLYINQATDLVTLKYNSQTNIYNFIFRNRDVFPPKPSPDGFNPTIATNSVIVNWLTN